MASEIDWAAIKAEYITTDTSYRELAQKYGVSKDSIARHSKAEHWVRQQRQHADRVYTKTVSKVETEKSNRLAKLITATEKTLDVALKALEDEQQFNRHLIEHRMKYDPANPLVTEDGTQIIEEQWVEEQKYEKIDTKALKEVAGVIKDLTPLLRDFYHIPTDSQAESQRIAAERLKLDQQKSSVTDTSGNGNTGVVLLPPIDETQLEPPIEEDSGEDEER